MSRTIRFFAALVASSCALLAFASLGSAQVRLYGADGAQGLPSNLYVLDPSSGAVLQTIGPIGFSVTGLAEDPSTGVLYGTTGANASASPGHLITVNKATGAGTVIGDLFPPVVNDFATAADIAFTPDATLFGWSEDTDDLVTINKSSGAATVVGNSGIGTRGSGLASTSAGTLFLTGNNDNGPLRTVDRSTGLTTVVATLNGSTGDPINAASFDAAGTLFGVLNHGSSIVPSGGTELLTINTSSGALGVRGPSVHRLDAIEFGHGRDRSVNLKKKFKKKGKKVRLFGQVDAPGNFATCENGQTVELQRKKPKATSFLAFRQLTTDNAGNFSTKTKVKKTFKYRAVLPESAVCDDRTSNVQKVKKKKKKKKKK